MEFNERFSKKEIWALKELSSFSIEVVHWSRRGGFDRYNNYDKTLTTHCWNVYVIVSKDHPVFSELTEDGTCSHESLDSLHWGSTFCEWHRAEDSTVLTKKYGSDYMHLGDDYEDCDSDTHWKAREIFDDAMRLYNTFKKLMEVK